MLTPQNICLIWLLLLLRVAGAVKLDAFRSTGDSTHSLDHSSGLSEAMGRIFDSADACDFLIVARTEDSSETVSQTICAHKVILLPFRPFNVSKGAESITISMSRPCLQHFTTFIRYLYTREVNVTTSSLRCIHWMASHFGAKRLMEDAGRLFTEVLPEDRSFKVQLSLYNYATETGDLLLQENCLRYLAWNYHNLTTSPAWTQLSVQLLESLLLRADLVAPDEYFVLRSVESWITDQGNSTTLETQAKLLSHVRFPMIPAERLHDLESSSPLYSAHRGLYQEKMLKALQFNVLLFSKIQASPAFNKEDADYQSRIYTGGPWSTVLDPSKDQQPVYFPPPSRRNPYDRYSRLNPSRTSFGVSSYTLAASLETPVHNSLIFQKDKVQWRANILQTQQDCSNEGLVCDSLPMARLRAQRSVFQDKVSFRNRLLLMCRGSYVVQVQDFKNDVSPVKVNGTYVVSYPCPGDQYTFQFVVRPQYV
ncbi:galectin-3-binding protein A-like [Takifugu flavidus]|uniref:BTB domain-containing protein n=1 Tax=Takifugu bimaculatus TaxID=433685 RepID=A0A4Z2BYH7_9TELE|nr:galectin-3-binding protein A-like [Takifugu flavidus]TNM97215.1 hypothetical protein fugu_015371 [Takifugu bimaculatus]